jgi:hypothetical protein
VHAGKKAPRGATDGDDCELETLGMGQDDATIALTATRTACGTADMGGGVSDDGGDASLSTDQVGEWLNCTTLTRSTLLLRDLRVTPGFGGGDGASLQSGVGGDGERGANNAADADLPVCDFKWIRFCNILSADNLMPLLQPGDIPSKDHRFLPLLLLFGICGWKMPTIMDLLLCSIPLTLTTSTLARWIQQGADCDVTGSIESAHLHSLGTGPAWFKKWLEKDKLVSTLVVTFLLNSTIPQNYNLHLLLAVFFFRFPCLAETY